MLLVKLRPSVGKIIRGAACSPFAQARTNEKPMLWVMGIPQANQHAVVFPRLDREDLATGSDTSIPIATELPAVERLLSERLYVERLNVGVGTSEAEKRGIPLVGNGGVGNERNRPSTWTEL